MSKYYLPDAEQGGFTTLYRYLARKERPRPKFPSAIQFQTVSHCNANCLFCGWRYTHKELPQGTMDEALFRKIADECGSHFVGRISPYLMNEPLLDRSLPDRIAYLVKISRPGTRIKINTNGALLTQEMSEGLVDSGLRHLWVSVQGYSPETYKESMGLDLGRTLDNIDRFLDIRDKRRADLPKLTVTTLKTKIVEGEIEYAKKYWADRNVRFKIHTPDNRSGQDLEEIAVNKPKPKRNCDLFLKQAYILYNGDMVICCHDWRRSVVLGNVGESSIRHIWNSLKFTDLIRQYNEGDFTNLEICRNCLSS
jgi:radical SAM protein with 4Fe4S-binding SPASM domain